jgi:hypothetical protein
LSLSPKHDRQDFCGRQELNSLARSQVDDAAAAAAARENSHVCPSVTSET